MIRGFTAGKSARFISGFTGAVFLPFTGFDFFSITGSPSMNGSFPKNLPRLEKGRCHRGSGPLAIRDASLRPRRALRRAPDNEKRALALNCHQRLGCFDLLRLLQGFLGHFGFPSFDLPGWASPCVHAKRSPNLGVVSPIRNPLNLWHFAFDRALAHSATHVRSVELITAC